MKKIKSELMRGLLPPGIDCAPPSTLHVRDNGTNITLLSESSGASRCDKGSGKACRLSPLVWCGGYN